MFIDTQKVVASHLIKLVLALSKNKDTEETDRKKIFLLLVGNSKVIKDKLRN